MKKVQEYYYEEPDSLYYLQSLKVVKNQPFSIEDIINVRLNRDSNNLIEYSEDGEKQNASIEEYLFDLETSENKDLMDFFREHLHELQILLNTQKKQNQLLIVNLNKELLIQKRNNDRMVEEINELKIKNRELNEVNEELQTQMALNENQVDEFIDDQIEVIKLPIDKPAIKPEVKEMHFWLALIFAILVSVYIQNLIKIPNAV